MKWLDSRRPISPIFGKLYQTCLECLVTKSGSLEGGVWDTGDKVWTLLYPPGLWDPSSHGSDLSSSHPRQNTPLGLELLPRSVRRWGWVSWVGGSLVSFSHWPVETSLQERHPLWAWPAPDLRVERHAWAFCTGLHPSVIASWTLTCLGYLPQTAGLWWSCVGRAERPPVCICAECVKVAPLNLPFVLFHRVVVLFESSCL